MPASWNLTDGAKSILKHISYVAASGIIAGLLGLLFNILAARVLGPAVFGKYSLVLSISRFLMIPMVYGLTTATIKYASNDLNKEETSKILSTATITIITLSLFSATVFYLGGHKISSFFNVEISVFIGAIFYSLFSSLSQFGKAFLQTRKRFKMLSSMEITTAALSLTSLFIALYYFKEMSFVSPTAASTIGFVIPIIVFAYLIKKYLHRFSFDFAWSLKLLTYGQYTILSTASTFLTLAADKLILNSHFPLITVGIYTAYFAASQSFTVNKLLMAIWTVLSPLLSDPEHGKKGYTTLKKNIFLVTGIIFIINFFCIIALVLLFGNDYPMLPMFAMLFSVSSSLAFASGLYTILLNAHDLKGRKHTALSNMACAILNLILNLIFIPIYGMYAGAVILVITNLILVLLLEIISKKTHI